MQSKRDLAGAQLIAPGKGGVINHAPTLKPPGFSYFIKIWLVLILAVWSLGVLPGCETQAPPREAKVSRVIDGDTLVLEGGAQVRLLGIDAPELEKEGRPAEFLAHQSKAALSDLTRGQKLRLEYDVLRYDHYGRLLAYLFLPDNTMVSAEMVRRGWAHVYLHHPNLRYREFLQAAQREAMEANRGVWQKALTQDEPYYLANRSSMRFHRPECPLGAKTAPTNRLRLETLKEAYLQGFSPCRSCKP
jgi:micrococcal nuclease